MRHRHHWWQWWRRRFDWRLQVTNYSLNVGDVFDIIDENGTQLLANGVTASFSNGNVEAAGAIGTQPFTVRGVAAGTCDVTINGVMHTLTVSNSFDWQLGTKQ